MKRDDNEFCFDIQYPFTPLIAIGVGITCFDFKLASQWFLKVIKSKLSSKYYLF